MNQISNQGQQPGQHSVQQQQVPHQPRYPSQYPVPPAPYYNGVYDPRHQQNVIYNQQLNHATLTLPHNTQMSITRDTNGMTNVDVAAPIDNNQLNQGFVPSNQGYVQMIHPYQYMQQYAPPPQYQQAPVPQPVVQKPARAKRILSFVDPNTNATVDLPQKEQKLDVSTASSPFEPNKQDTKAHTPVNEIKDAAPEIKDEDINSTFGRMVANRAVSAKGLAGGQTHEEEQQPVPAAAPFPSTTSFNRAPTSFDPAATSFVPTSHASSTTTTFVTSALPFTPANFKAEVSERVKDATPAAKEQTPTFDSPQKIEHSPTPEQKVVAPSIVLEETQAETSGIDEERSETSETPQKLDRASLIQDYENKISEFVSIPENVEDLQNKVYSRKLVQLLREIIKNFHTVPCPLSEQVLKKIGIDRATMPTPANVSHKSKFGGRGDSFTPGWANNAQQNIRRPYNTRGSKNNDGQNNQKKNNQNRPPQISNRPSIQRQKFGTLTRNADAWKPDVLNAGGNAVDVSSVEARIAKTRKEVRGTLNKITPTTYGDLSVEMINKCVWRDEDTLPTVVELIFIKAVEEPTFVGLYSDLCRALHKAEQNMDGNTAKPRFHGAIIRKCQSSFETTALSQFQETINSIENELQEEEKKDEKDEKKIADLNERLEDLKVKEKRRMLGTIKFISHLFRISLLNYKIIENCIVILIRNAENAEKNQGTELMTEYAVDLMKHVGPHVIERKEDTTKLDGYVTYLEKFKPKVSNRVKFMIVDLTELRDKKWQKKGDGPKTKKQVEEDVAKEQRQNERERDVYEQTAADQSRKRSNVMDKQPQRYGGRPSTDNKKDRLHAAAAAANASGSTLKKDTSLAKYDQQPARLGSTKKAWGAPNANTNANPPAPSPQGNKGPPRVIQRHSTDARPNDARKSTAQKDNKPSVASTPKVDPRSASSTPPPDPSSSSRSQNNTPTFTPEDQFDKGAFKAGFKQRLQAHIDGGGEIDETVKSLIEFNSELNNPVLFFEQMFKYCCEHLKLNEEKERHAVSALVVKCFKDPVLKNSFAPAFKKYCKYLVEEDIDSDLPHLKKIFPEFVARLMADSAGTVPTAEFAEGFKEFHESENYMFARTFAEFGRILHSRKEAQALSWVFEEFTNADPHYKSDEMQKILAKQPIDYDENHKNLKDLLILN